MQKRRACRQPLVMIRRNPSRKLQVWLLFVLCCCMSLCCCVSEFEHVQCRLKRKQSGLPKPRRSPPKQQQPNVRLRKAHCLVLAVSMLSNACSFPCLLVLLSHRSPACYAAQPVTSEKHPKMSTTTTPLPPRSRDCKRLLSLVVQPADLFLPPQWHEGCHWQKRCHWQKGC